MVERHDLEDEHRKVFGQLTKMESERHLGEVASLGIMNYHLLGKRPSPYTSIATNSGIHTELLQRFKEKTLAGKKILVVGGLVPEAYSYLHNGAEPTIIQPYETDALVLRGELPERQVLHGGAVAKLDELRGKKFDAIVSKSVLQYDVVDKGHLAEIIDKSLDKSDLQVHWCSNDSPDGSEFARKGWKVTEKTIDGQVKLVIMERMKEKTAK